MKTYRLKEDLLGQPKGTEYTADSKLIVIEYKGGQFALAITNTELFEEVRIARSKYSEDEVYFDGVCVPIYVGDEYWYAYRECHFSETATHSVMHDQKVDDTKFIRFKSRQACLDYIALYRAKQKISLTIGQEVEGIYDFYRVNGASLSMGGTFRNNKLTGYVVHMLQPCAVVLQGTNNYFLPLGQLTKPKLTFGGKSVELTAFSKENVTITCDGQRGDYKSVVMLNNALRELSNFKFGKYKLSIFDKDFRDTRVQIGCTEGTIVEVEKIIEACEELLNVANERSLLK